MAMRDPRDDIEDDRPDSPRGLFLSRRGNWFHDGDRIRHHGLTGLLDRCVKRADDDSLIVTTGRDVLPFICEDCPVFVRAVDIDGDTLWAYLSTGVRDPIDVIAVSHDDRLRSVVQSGALWALWTRSAAQALEPFVDADDDGAFVRVGERCLRFISREALWQNRP